MRTIHINGQSNGNGNGSASPVPVVRGRSVAQRKKLTASQRAVLAAKVFDGTAAYEPTQTEMARSFGVSVPMIGAAKKLTPLAQQAVLGGKVRIGHFAKPKLVDLQKDDSVLRVLIQRHGVNHIVDVAAAMEAAE